MKILFFSSDEYVRSYFRKANQDYGYDIDFTKVKLSAETVSLAKGYSIVSCFIYDELDATVLRSLSGYGVKLVTLRSVGYNNVDLKTAAEVGITIAYVPTYSPYAVAEHAVALILSLNRKIHKAYFRVREGNFSLKRLLGFDLHGSTVGIIGTGRIGLAFARIMHGFGSKLLCYDKVINPECVALGATYLGLKKLLSRAEIISLHCPLTPETHHIIDEATVALMQPGVMLINTSRGGLIDTQAVVTGLKSGRIGYLGLDVYEEEQNLFFSDLSERVINDDLFSRLQTFPNVLITCHQGFLTQEAFTDITNVTLTNIKSFITGSGTIYKVESLT